MILELYYYRDGEEESEYGWYIGDKKGNPIVFSPELYPNRTKCIREAKEAREILNENEIIVGTIKRGLL